jgi:phosphatidylserine decarboxylase
MRNKISRIFGSISGTKFPKPIQKFINESYVKGFKIDMSEFKNSSEYNSLTELFTRELVHGRKFDKADEIFISPSDGLCLECGRSNELKALSVKGYNYDIKGLLGSLFDESDLRENKNGDENLNNKQVAQKNELDYANIYLSPRDYHRYHAPCDMQILSALYLPGDLYSVSIGALKRISNLYAKNERVVLKCKMKNDKILWMVFVGALNVGKIKFDFDERIQTNAMANFSQSYKYNELYVLKGEQLGMFELGSTIVLISQANSVEYNLSNGKKIKFGDSIGMIK